MKNLFKKMLVVSAIALTALGAPKKSEAGIGVISLIGGPAGVPVIVAGAGVMVGGSAAVLGTCYVGMAVADWSEDCPIFMNFTFWPGLVLLGSDSADNGLVADIMEKYSADEESANRIYDRIYNKALRASRQMEAQETINPEEALVVNFDVSLSREELEDIVTPEFSNSRGFELLVQDYE